MLGGHPPHGRGLGVRAWCSQMGAAPGGAEFGTGADGDLTLNSGTHFIEDKVGLRPSGQSRGVLSLTRKGLVPPSNRSWPATTRVGG
jgi:hypothetical protein